MNRKKYIVRRNSIPHSEWIPLQLGKMYYSGIDLEPDREKALFHFKNAAANGNIEAIHFLELLEESHE